MICPKCYNELSRDFFCETCETNVNIYRKILNRSKLLFNLGLQKAKSNNLTGAIENLEQSLEYDKYNKEARNLIGLIFFQIGEINKAFTHWNISVKYNPKDNIAKSYLEETQAKDHIIAKYNRMIEKYNICIDYANGDSKDLAIIQLKKIVSIHPKFLKANNLLILLYMQRKEYDNARTTINKVLKIDKANHNTLRYLEYINEILDEDNELCIENKVQPIDKKDDTKKIKYKIGKIDVTGYGYNVGYILFGIIIGICLVIILWTPNQLSNKNVEIKELTKEVESTKLELEDKTNELTQDNNLLESEILELQKQVDNYNGFDEYDEQIEKLHIAMSAYVSNDKITAADNLYMVDVGIIESNEEALQLYNELLDSISDYAASYFYSQGYKSYEQKNYYDSIESLEKSVKLDINDTNIKDSMYFLAKSYHLIDDNEQAIKYYNEIIDNYPGTRRANDSKYWRDQILD